MQIFTAASTAVNICIILLFWEFQRAFVFALPNELELKKVFQNTQT